MTQQNEFMLLFRYEPNENYQPTPEELNITHQQWGSYIGKMAIQEKLVCTYQLGFEGRQIASDTTVKNNMYLAGNQIIGGNMIIKANGFDEATAIAQECPILHIGGTVEVRNIVPM